MNRRAYSRNSSLFLLELIIAILFFSIASAVCVQIFVKSHLLSQQASQLRNAVNEASSAAQIIDHASSFDRMEDDLTEILGDNSRIFYDENWRKCQKDKATFSMVIQLDQMKTMVNGTISVIDLSNQSQIYELTVSHHLQDNGGLGGE